MNSPKPTRYEAFQAQAVVYLYPIALFGTGRVGSVNENNCRIWADRLNAGYPTGRLSWREPGDPILLHAIGSSTIPYWAIRPVQEAVDPAWGEVSP